MIEIAYVGIGTNIEPRTERIEQAVASLATVGKVLALSTIYESVPYGVTDQPRFLNAAAALATGLSAPELHIALKELESTLGRIQRDRWHEREIDFDILFYGSSTYETPELTIPHRDLQNRSFVVIPLQEIAPNIMHPVLKKTVRQLAEAFADVSDQDLRPVAQLPLPA